MKHHKMPQRISLTNPRWQGDKGGERRARQTESEPQKRLFTKAVPRETVITELSRIRERAETLLDVIDECLETCNDCTETLAYASEGSPKRPVAERFSDGTPLPTPDHEEE